MKGTKEHKDIQNFWGAGEIPGIRNVCGASSWYFLLESSVSHPGKWQLHLSTHSPVLHQSYRLCSTDQLPQARPFPAKGHPHHNTCPGHSWGHLQNLFHNTTKPPIRMSFAYPHRPLQLAQRTHAGIWSLPDLSSRFFSSAYTSWFLPFQQSLGKHRRT